MKKSILFIMSMIMFFVTYGQDTTATVTDIDGNVYRAVKIGTQTWMAGNLKATRYSDGSAITNVIDAGTWKTLMTGAYCWYDNDETTNKPIYGALYNWYAVNTGKLCPTGWHVPSDAEWTTLTAFLGDYVAGGKLKETGTTHWQTPNTDATNETGFTALPGGYRHNYDGMFYSIGEAGEWWSSTEYNSACVWIRTFDFLGGGVGTGYSENKPSGYSVRCIRDN